MLDREVSLVVWVSREWFREEVGWRWEAALSEVMAARLVLSFRAVWRSWVLLEGAGMLGGLQLGVGRGVVEGGFGVLVGGVEKGEVGVPGGLLVNHSALQDFR